MAAFQLQPGERLLINDPHASWMMLEMKGIPGTLRVTQNRVVFERPANPYFGFLKFLWKKLGAEELFEIRRSEITGASAAAGAMGKVRLKIETKYERPKMFDTMKIEVIVGELRKSIPA